MTKDKRKLRAQVKSRFYYLFWGAAPVSVFAGQMQVGGGFRRMAESLDNVLDAPIRLDIGVPHRRIPDFEHPMIIR